MRGNFILPVGSYIVLCPAADHEEIRDWAADMEPPPTFAVVDPAWSLEMIIGRLAGFDADELGPF